MINNNVRIQPEERKSSLDKLAEEIDQDPAFQRVVHPAPPPAAGEGTPPVDPSSTKGIVQLTSIPFKNNEKAGKILLGIEKHINLHRGGAALDPSAVFNSGVGNVTIGLPPTSGANLAVMCAYAASGREPEAVKLYEQVMKRFPGTGVDKHPWLREEWQGMDKYNSALAFDNILWLLSLYGELTVRNAVNFSLQDLCVDEGPDDARMYKGIGTDDDGKRWHSRRAFDPAATALGIWWMSMKVSNGGVIAEKFLKYMASVTRPCGVGVESRVVFVPGDEHPHMLATISLVLGKLAYVCWQRPQDIKLIPEKFQEQLVEAKQLLQGFEEFAKVLDFGEDGLVVQEAGSNTILTKTNALYALALMYAGDQV